MFFYKEGQIREYINITLDYIFQNEKVNSTTLDYLTSSSLILRRIIDITPKYILVTPLCLGNLVRAELEITRYSRDFLETLDSSIASRTIISLLLLTFINSFGLYRNAYRSLIGFYYIAVGLSYYKRARRVNVFLIILSPYRSNFADIIKAISRKGITALNRGIEVDIPNS